MTSAYTLRSSSPDTGGWTDRDPGHHDHHFSTRVARHRLHVHLVRAVSTVPANGSFSKRFFRRGAIVT